MPLQQRGPWWGLRALAAIQAIYSSGLGCVMIWFFFPHVLLVLAAAFAAAAGLGALVVPFLIVLDPGRGEVAISVACWTRHVPLTEVTRVEESGRLGVEIGVANGWFYGFFPFRRRPLLTAMLRSRLRTGFAGMEAAITRAAAIARGDDPDRPLPGYDGSARGVRDACLLAGAGLLALGMAVLVRPQTGGGLVHAGALVLRVMYGGTGAVVVLIGAVLLYRAWHNRRVAGQPG